MDIILAILLGAVQGLTEFLPVSSTGHLVLAEHLFGLSPHRFGLTFDITLHLGTLLALLYYFRADLVLLLSVRKEVTRWKLLILATIPAVLAGGLYEDAIGSTLRSPQVVGWSLVVIAGILAAAELGAKKNTAQSPSLARSLGIGCAQALALIPGVSRSGVTMGAGMLMGLTRQAAARFSFLLAIPVMLGAGMKRLLSTTQELQMGDGIVFVGMISAGLVGYITIAFFLRYLQRGSLYPFVLYRLVVGGIVLFFVK